MININTPLDGNIVRSLKVGDSVAISGTLYTARDIAHQRLCNLIARGESLPIDLQGAVIYFVGPTPAPPGRVIGSAGPTTSSRMDAFSPNLLEVGLKGMIGKGYRGQVVRDSLQKNVAVHFTAIGGAGALLSRYITSVEVVAYEELGTEAIRKLTVENFPVIVAYDSYGNTVYK
ncbi:MAG: Fe-S-containing hydro-lyase [Anaerohalosphaeraceae bacterium]|nr:Fe-S-containing hydro-lyase [Anaerohalosphaeraceae bacterium]